MASTRHQPEIEETAQLGNAEDSSSTNIHVFEMILGSNAAVDRYHVVYGICCLLGLGTLLPFNVLITEQQFFAVRTHVAPTTALFADNITNIIVVSFQLVNFAALALLVPVQSRLTLRQLVFWPLVANSALLGLASLVAAWVRLPGEWVMVAAVYSAFITGGCTALLQAGSFAVASRFPALYMQGVLAGQAVAGVSVSLVSFATLWAAPPAEQPTASAVAVPAILYFGTATAVMSFCAVAYAHMWKLPYVRCRWGLDDVSAYSALLGSSTAAEDGRAEGHGAAPLLPGAEEAASLLVATAGSSSHVEREKPETNEDGDGGAGDTVGGADVPLRDLLRPLWGHLLALVLAFLITLTAFPGISSAICSVRNGATTAPCLATSPSGRFFGDLFVPFMFLCYNCGDLLGRALAGVGPWAKRSPPAAVLLAYSVARGGLLVALMLCNVVTPRTWHLPLVFRSDVVPLGLNTLLGVTNGHLASTVCMHAPQLLPEALRARGGGLLAFAITGGVTVGSVVSLLLSTVLQL